MDAKGFRRLSKPSSPKETLIEAPKLCGIPKGSAIFERAPKKLFEHLRYSTIFEQRSKKL